MGKPTTSKPPTQPAPAKPSPTPAKPTPAPVKPDPVDPNDPYAYVDPKGIVPSTPKKAALKYYEQMKKQPSKQKLFNGNRF
jgi:hypothetical protein